MRHAFLSRLFTFCAFSSMMITGIAIYLHFKNYRMPMDQRLIVRIQLLLPLFALSSWLALHNYRINYLIEPIREMYEAFTIYTFFTLLTNILGGERNIIIKASGRPPKRVLFPLNYISNIKIDISDPLTFLYIKRGVLQYVWIKPFLCICTVIVKASNENGDVQHSTLNLVVLLVYNVSISLSLYCLALFWYCLVDDLAPYRPFPKFLCIKAVIFFSFWQGFAISVLSYLGAELPSHTQAAIMCLEMLPLALAHWSAFSYKDYATSKMIGFARLPVYYAIRDTFGIVDLVKDFRSTFYGREYGYRQFDSVEAVLDHPESASRQGRIMAGLRYKQGGKSRYWIPESSIKRKGSLSSIASTGSGSPSPPPSSKTRKGSSDSNMPSSSLPLHPSYVPTDQSPLLGMSDSQYNTLDPTDEDLFTEARKLPYGDYHYPAITVRESIAYIPVFQRQQAAGYRDSILEEQYETFGREEGDELLLERTEEEDERTRQERRHKKAQKGRHSYRQN